MGREERQSLWWAGFLCTRGCKVPGKGSFSEFTQIFLDWLKKKKIHFHKIQCMGNQLEVKNRSQQIWTGRQRSTEYFWYGSEEFPPNLLLPLQVYNYSSVKCECQGYKLSHFMDSALLKLSDNSKNQSNSLSQLPSAQCPKSRPHFFFWWLFFDFFFFFHYQQTFDL